MKCLLWILIFLVPCSATAQSPFTAPDRNPEFQDLEPSSLYVPMRDGVRIAMDVLLPKGLQGVRKVPALFKISRRPSRGGRNHFRRRSLLGSARFCASAD